MIGFTFAYVILLHYGIKALGFLIPQRGFRGKYESLLAGVEGLGAGWLLSIALGNSAAVFSGFVFIASVFVATSVVERLGWRWLNPAVRVIRLSQPAELVASAKASPRWFGVWIVAGVVVYPLVGVFLVAPLLREALRLPSP